MPLILLLFGLVLEGMPAHAADLPSPRFQEVWAYLQVGEESALKPVQGVTDLVYFGAYLNSWGELVQIPNADRIRTFAGRKHLALVILDNFTQTHLAVHPAFAVRDQLLTDLTTAAAPYDGVQLDFEAVASRDKESFWSFVGDLKSRLGAKTLSLAVPARSAFVDDAFDYAKLAQRADRLIVMAYDEHWSGSAPGPVASPEWTVKVAKYALGKVDAAKLVMGAPFYGRAWADKALSRAYKFPTISDLLTAKGLAPGRPGGTPSFEYEETVRVKVYFDDADSLRDRLERYAALGIRNTAFWRLGQEDPRFWPILNPEVSYERSIKPLQEGL